MELGRLEGTGLVLVVVLVLALLVVREVRRQRHEDQVKRTKQGSRRLELAVARARKE